VAGPPCAGSRACEVGHVGFRKSSGRIERTRKISRGPGGRGKSSRRSEGRGKTSSSSSRATIIRSNPA
jgi:hypothetical protein